MAQENQARRLLNDLARYRAELERTSKRPVPETVAVHRWLSEVFEPAVAAVPAELWGKRDAAEVFHEALEHRWFLSQQAGEDIGLMPAVEAYVQDVLRPEGLVLEYATAGEALNALTTGICDAFVFDLPVLAAAKRATPSRYGALAGRLGPTERYGVVLPKGSKLRPAVSKAIASLQRDGTIRRAAAASFGSTLASVPVIR